MRAQTLASRMELFVAAATLAAHAGSGADGFRQRDVRFFSELFSNFAEPDHTSELVVHNVQIQRYLEFLAKEGLLKRRAKRGGPVYRLSRVGMIELLSRLVDAKRPYARGHFLFLVFFVWSYHERLQSLVRAEGEHYPPSLRIELEALLDVDTLLQRETRRVTTQIAKLRQRVEDAQRTSELARERLRGGQHFEDLVRDLERAIPYELNSRKPLSELIAGLQPDQRRWELIDGNRLRAAIIWEPQIALARGYLEQLRELQKRLGSKSEARRL